MGIYNLFGKVNRKTKDEIKSYIEWAFEDIFEKPPVLHETDTVPVTCSKDPNVDGEEIRFSLKMPSQLEMLLDNKESTFSEALILAIDMNQLDDPAVYNRAGISRQLFNKIKNDVDYHPTKNTAIRLACALRMRLQDMEYFLSRAGYTLSRSIRADIIIRYCIENGIYQIKDIDSILTSMGEATLGQKE